MSVAQLTRPEHPVIDVEPIFDQKMVYVLKSKWGYEGVFTTLFLAEDYRDRLLKLAAYRLSHNPGFDIAEVPLNPIM